MRRADLAEAILSLAAPRERAAAIAGDFIEEDLGAFRFWFLVGRTAIAQGRRQLAAQPKAVAGILIRGLLTECACFLAGCFAYLWLMLVLISLHKVCFNTAAWPDWADSPLQWSLVNLMVPFLTGRWITWQLSERACSGCLALAMFHAVVNLFAGLALLELPLVGIPWHADVIFVLKLFYWHDFGTVLRSAMLYATLYPLMLLAGSVSFRTRQARARVR